MRGFSQSLNISAAVSACVTRVVSWREEHLGRVGDLTEAEAQALLTSGFDGFLRKPFHVRQVIEAVEDAMAVVYCTLNLPSSPVSGYGRFT